ncbi:hypothetical protein EDD37DRAFT_603394 [Exophiala viscosa]|uniref:Uncharacterized protein n=1 Tax=Exophiala viscosa TaxID=2486360 RepID=A0AAN6DKG3_9EURO|nr:hypothetical protein EDD36DRAFT_423818 [Exophiala viscosa]KAI1628461.1 hypothetical protein EDD37DRAFT_603394 [Exophiala viscosa]
MTDRSSTYRTQGHEGNDADLAAAWQEWLTHPNPFSTRQQSPLNNTSSQLVFLKHEDSFTPSQDPLGDSQNPLKTILKHRHILKTRRQLRAVQTPHEQPSTQIQRVNTPHTPHDHYYYSTKMCFKYLCKDCKLEKYDYCKEYVESGRTWCTVTVENPWGAKKKKCETCVLMREVTHRLKVLVLREPYLLTEGMGGAPEKPAWEMEEEKAKEGAVVGVVEVESDSD